MTLPFATYNQLKYIPGEKGLPFFGNTLELVHDTVNYGMKMRSKHGNIYRNYTFGRQNITIAGAEINEFVLMDKDKNFSSKGGWETFLGKLFPRGLMLRDFDEHRLHRKAMAGAFKSGPMQAYLKGLDEIVIAGIAEWRENESLLFYPAIKQLTLDVAAQSFWGDNLSGKSDEVKSCFINMIKAATSVIRAPLPFTQMKKGVKARERIVAIFGSEVPKRRENLGDDLFSELCRATMDNGELLSVSDIVDHMSFFLMAAHDTQTSSISSLIFHLAKYPEWQEKLREEVKALGMTKDSPFTTDYLDKMPLTEMAFKEALRLYPPVPGIPRQAVRDVTIGGYLFPKGTLLNLNLMATHYMEEHWENPREFNPLRFTPENIRTRHKYAWVPFSGGAHTCLGLNFAYMQSKCLITRLLSDMSFTLKPGYNDKWDILPIPKPVDGLPLILRKL
jgi:cytochrome P450